MKQIKSILLASLLSMSACTLGDNNAEDEPAPAPAEPSLVGGCDPGFQWNGASCVDIDECAASATTCGAHNACVNAPGGFDCLASSCAGILELSPNAQDGEYPLYVGGDPAKAWTAYCADMASGHPLEYLTLVHAGADANFSQYTAGVFSPGTSVRTSYTKLRIDPATLAIDIGDQRFSTSAGQLVHSGNQGLVTSMPFAVAMSCDGSDSGLAKIDLRDTSFVVASSFVPGGLADASVDKIDDQQITLHGGGSCGWNGPQGVAFNPFNKNGGGFVLQLAYR